MIRAEINALEIRFKAMALMLINLELLEGQIADLIEQAHRAFDAGIYDSCKKALDLASLEIVRVLEL